MQKTQCRLWVIFGLLALALLVFPINNLPLRILKILVILGCFSLLLYLSRKRKFILSVLLLVGTAVGVFLVFPGKPINREKLRDTYLNSLRSYDGTRYLWGGENSLGIDCSGLVRAGLIKANFKQGLLTSNPELVRQSLSFWWHDCSAKAMGEGYQKLTRRLAEFPSINSIDGNRILPGDIAVTANGVHVLAFLGHNEWIEADPDLGKVVIVHTPTTNNPWFKEPVHIMRWTELEAK